MGVPKWLKPKSPQEQGRRLEKRLAKKLGVKPQPGSGAFAGMPEDVETLDMLIQVKHTTKRSYKLNLDDLETLYDNAIKRGKKPVLVLQMGNRSWWIRPGVIL